MNYVNYIAMWLYMSVLIGVYGGIEYKYYLTLVVLWRGGDKIPPAHFRHQNSGTAKYQAMRFCDFS